jgi:hypothetical protein
VHKAVFKEFKVLLVFRVHKEPKVLKVLYKVQ